MSYEIRWSQKSEKYLERLPKDVSHRIVHKVDSIKDDPFRFVEHYEGYSYFKLRVGYYRVLLDINPAEKLVEIRVVGHGSTIYKKF
jgi:mRNA interferase RelE/StbE